MNLEALENARRRIPSIPVLINIVSQRTKQLNRGARPLLRPLSDREDKSDIALREIAAGLILPRMDLQAVEEDEKKRSFWSRHI
ncbi:MAG: DNA-directed RNA polymerase subunit omega [Kiritimatiellae bacterium]|nr:DNA-directed RNA polymerase subunit omega [Kiritimatiellia bacterium]